MDTVWWSNTGKRKICKRSSRSVGRYLSHYGIQFVLVETPLPALQGTLYKQRKQQQKILKDTNGCTIHFWEDKKQDIGKPDQMF